MAKKKSKAGRKPLEDKKVTARFYPRESQVKALGGLEKTQQIAMEAVVMAAAKAAY